MKVWSNIKIAVRVALRMDMNPARDDWHDLYDRIRSLMAAYTASPEGEGEDACILMTRLAVLVADPTNSSPVSPAISSWVRRKAPRSRPAAPRWARTAGIS